MWLQSGSIVVNMEHVSEVIVWPDGHIYLMTTSGREVELDGANPLRVMETCGVVADVIRPTLDKLTAQLEARNG